MTDLVEVRAIVRVEMLDRLVHRLKESGIPRLTVTRVHSIGAGVDPASAKLSLEEATEYADKALVRFICAAEHHPGFTELIRQTARTGRPGDGIVYVLPVLALAKIRNDITGLEALK